MVSTRASGALLAEVACWSALGYVVWLLTLSQVTISEAVTAAGCAPAVAVAAVATRHVLGAKWRVHPAWVRWFGPACGAVLLETVRLWAAALRGDRRALRGSFRETQLPDTDPAPLAAGRRALATLTLSATPGSCVIGSRDDRHRLRVHSVVPGPPDLSRVVRKRP